MLRVFTLVLMLTLTVVTSTGHTEILDQTLCQKALASGANVIAATERLILVREPTKLENEAWKRDYLRSDKKIKPANWERYLGRVRAFLISDSGMTLPVVNFNFGVLPSDPGILTIPLGINLKAPTEFEGKGYALEAKWALISLAFKNMPNVSAIYDWIAPDNIRSRKLHARLGYEYVGSSRPADASGGEDGDIFLWKLTKARYLEMERRLQDSGQGLSFFYNTNLNDIGPAMAVSGSGSSPLSPSR